MTIDAATSPSGPALIVPLMTAAVGVLGDVELGELEAAVGSASFKRGRSYAHGNRVHAIEWDPEEETLSGSVIGHGAIYSTAAVFAGDDGELTFAEGECSCPVGYNCKHVAALVIAATDTRGAPGANGVQRPPRRVRGAAVTVVGGAAASADRGAASACGGRSAGDRAVVARERHAGRRARHG